METGDTIVALATPPGMGALALIRVSGLDAIVLVKKMLAEKERFDGAPAKEIRLYRFITSNTKEPIDEITAVKYFEPHSFTGENMVEIICHGGNVVTERILESLVDGGARYAVKGEFTRRAFCNGKTNLVKAESINQIVQSKSITQQKSAICSYLDKYQALINTWEEKIKEILMEVESAIEFGEDGDISERDSWVIIKQKVKTLKDEVISELEKRKAIREVESGIYIAIVGPINAGKSSLFNLVMDFDRSIVDTEGGTTRDFVSEDRKIGNVLVKFIDTAGLRETVQRVEKKGVERSREFIRNSKVLIWVSAADEEIKPEELKIKDLFGQKVLGVINKIDLGDGIEKERMFRKRSIPHIKISAINRNERERVENFIVQELEVLLDGVSYDCIISNKRQEKIIEGIYNELERIENRPKDEEEIIAEHCKNIINKLEEFVGKVTTEDILDKIFDEFCIGK